MKSAHDVLNAVAVGVAPLAGAWIEIAQIGGVNMAETVAPLAGAWIEILNDFKSNIYNPSLPSRERGLKYIKYSAVSNPTSVAPLAGAWIEIEMVGGNR